ncbi:MAG: hypothetical protein M5U28_27975 [Sandaracinaceae bacterium]|nr:hypothetical protein [Sandaracinaceae bacterium]
MPITGGSSGPGILTLSKSINATRGTLWASRCTNTFAGERVAVRESRTFERVQGRGKRDPGRKAGHAVGSADAERIGERHARDELRHVPLHGPRHDFPRRACEPGMALPEGEAHDPRRAVHDLRVRRNEIRVEDF